MKKFNRHWFFFAMAAGLVSAAVAIGGCAAHKTDVSTPPVVASAPVVQRVPPSRQLGRQRDMALRNRLTQIGRSHP